MEKGTNFEKVAIPTNTYNANFRSIPPTDKGLTVVKNTAEQCIAPNNKVTGHALYKRHGNIHTAKVYLNAPDGTIEKGLLVYVPIGINNS